jgi:ABC-type phosphate transport system auxiliary subunit
MRKSMAVKGEEMTLPNPPPPFDADAARRLITETGEWIDAWSADTWIVDLRDNLRAAVAEVERLREQIDKHEDLEHHMASKLIDAERERDRLRERMKELEEIINAY